MSKHAPRNKKELLAESREDRIERVRKPLLSPDQREPGTKNGRGGMGLLKRKRRKLSTG